MDSCLHQKDLVALLLLTAFIPFPLPPFRYYPQWSKAEEFASAVGYPEGTGREQDLSFFVPGELSFLVLVEPAAVP
jgi:hypothetical protein